MGEPNTSLRAVRQSMRLSQDELARAIRNAGQRAGEPNECSKRLIQRWEAGIVHTPRGEAAERLAAGQAYEASGHVAADELGVPVNPEWLTDEFHRVAARAGLPRIRLHDGRHTINSLMAAAGIPDHIRAAWCGHTVAVNVATYTHARPEDLAVARDALSGIFRAG